MAFRIRHICAAAIVFALLPAAAEAQGYRGYPYSIMTPEGTAASHHRGAARHGSGATHQVSPAPETAAEPHRPSLLGRERFIAIVEQNGDCIVCQIRDGEIGLAVKIVVGDRNRGWAATG